MSIEINQDILQDPYKALELEWIDTNGLGGWASSSVLGCNTRNYHGVLVAAVVPPVDRRLMLSRLDEVVSVNSELIPLATRDFGDALYPQGYKHLVKFSKSIFPSWEFRIGNNLIKKTLFCIQNTNSVCIRYELISSDSDAAIPIFFEPFVAGRDYHSAGHVDSNISQSFDFTDNSLLLTPRINLPAIKITAAFKNYQHNPAWHYRFFHREETRRGLADREDLLCYGSLESVLSHDTPLTLLVSCDSEKALVPEEAYQQELQSRQALSISSLTDACENNPKIISLLESLSIAARQFIVKRAGGKTIIAGYHWFTDWGRDTLIAIRGLCIATGRLEEAQQILQVFCDSVKNGLVPNRFVDTAGYQDSEAQHNQAQDSAAQHNQAEYNTVDASLWLFVAAYEFYNAGGDKNFVDLVLLPTLEKIFEAYSQGTSYQIKEDSDGLISAGSADLQLTWMDAKIGDWVVTPRFGKAVEINALWFNALSTLAQLAEAFGRQDLEKLTKQKANHTQISFNKIFWNEVSGSLYDCINPDFSDPSCRPNQLFAAGLPFSVLSKDRAESMLKVVREQLLTVRGLRTLAPTDNAYRPNYNGSPHERDSAYHQGTVWPWLLGTYVDAILFIDPVSAKKEARQILEIMYSHLYEAGLGTVSEIFDAEPPHTARGTISQAWSVSELLRICLKLKLS